MIHLMNKVYLDYQFSPIDMNTDNEQVWIGGMASNGHIKSNTSTFNSTEDLFKEYGDIGTLVRFLTSYGKKTIIKATEEDLNYLHVLHLLSIYPNISNEMLHRIIKFSIITHKYVYSKPSEHGLRNATGFKALRLLTLAEVTSIRKKVHNNVGIYTLNEKKNISAEYLLANYALDPLNTSVFNLELVRRVEKILLKGIANDYEVTRIDACSNLYNIKDYHGLDIDLESEDFEEQLMVNSNHIVLRDDLSADNLDVIKSNLKDIANLVEHMAKIEGQIATDLHHVALNYFSDDGRLSFEQFIELMKLERSHHTSFIFGRTEFKYSTNTIFIGMIYTGREDLAELKLC